MADKSRNGLTMPGTDWRVRTEPAGRRTMRNLTFILFLLPSLLLLSIPGRAAEEARGRDVKVTILSTMLTEFCGVGEWGFSALVEVDGHRVLFDTGARPDTVLKNAKELEIDLSGVDSVVLSHNHWDHTGGLVSLRSSLKKSNPSAMLHTHVGEGMFLPRKIDQEAVKALPRIPKEFLVSALDMKGRYEELGGRINVHSEPHELVPGVWITGPIPRIHKEKNWTPFMRIEQDGKMVEDTIPEDQAMVIETSRGTIVVVGCGHAGIVNTMEYARRMSSGKPVYAVVGGFHLIGSTDEQIRWTGEMMREFGVEHIVGAHCTGINPVGQLRESGNYGRERAVVGTVGSVFTLRDGIQTGLLNR